MNSDLERTLDDMEACLVAVEGLELVHRLAGPAECRIQIQDVSLDIDRKTAAMHFEMSRYRNGRRRSWREGGTVERERPVARILKYMAKLWVHEDFAMLGGVHTAQLVSGRWPNLEHFAQTVWDKVAADMRGRIRARTKRRLQDGIEAAMLEGLSVGDVQDIVNEIVVSQVQTS